MFEKILYPTDFSSEVLPVGEGILRYSDLDGACAAIDAVEDDYARNAHAAREIAADYFASERVLGHLVERAMEAVS